MDWQSGVLLVLGALWVIAWAFGYISTRLWVRGNQPPPEPSKDERLAESRWQERGYEADMYRALAAETETLTASLIDGGLRVGHPYLVELETHARESRAKAIEADEFRRSYRPSDTVLVWREWRAEQDARLGLAPLEVDVD